MHLMEKIIRDKTILAYVERCTALCWLMAVQDPPMTLLSDVSPDRLFDKTKYREYTKSGKYVGVHCFGRVYYFKMVAV